MTILEIKDLLKTTTGQKVVIVAPGPTLSNLAKMEDYDLAIFIGDSFRRTNLRAHQNWLVRANTEYPKLDDEDHLRHLRSFDGTLVFASSVMESDSGVANLMERAFRDRANFIFDQRHFYGKPCTTSQSCCEFRLEITIQELLAEKLAWPHHYSEGVTVLSHALALVLMLPNLQRVDIFGADLPLKASKYVYARAKQTNESKPSSLYSRIKTALRIGPRRTSQILRQALALRMLGSEAPSVFALDFVPLLSDFQYLSDAAASLGVNVRVSGESSTLLRLSGFHPL